MTGILVNTKPLIVIKCLLLIQSLATEWSNFMIALTWLYFISIIVSNLVNKFSLNLPETPLSNTRNVNNTSFTRTARVMQFASIVSLFVSKDSTINKYTHDTVTNYWVGLFLRHYQTWLSQFSNKPPLFNFGIRYFNMICWKARCCENFTWFWSWKLNNNNDTNTKPEVRVICI